MTGTAAFAGRKKATRRAVTPGKQDAPAAEPRPSLLNVGPVWITAIATLLTAVVGALVLLGIGDDPQPEVSIEEASSMETNLTAEGTYAGLLGTEQTVVLLMRPAGSDDLWAAIEVERAPADEDRGGAEAGNWTIDVPTGGRTYEIFAVVVPARRGGSFETIQNQLSDSGPEAEVVRARSDPVTVEGD